MAKENFFSELTTCFQSLVNALQQQVRLSFVSEVISDSYNVEVLSNSADSTSIFFVTQLITVP